MNLRFAAADDAPILREIYHCYTGTFTTFEYELPSVEEFTHRITHTLEKFPYLVAEENGTILGYAYAHPERERLAYQWNAELSIYLRPEATGRRIGTALYEALLELLTLQGVRNAYAIVVAPNPASEGLHRSQGFRLLGIHRKTGYKNRVWHDTLWYEREVAPHNPEPAPLIPIGQIDCEAIRRILEAHGW